MPVDERARHQLYRKLEEVLGPEEAGTLMNHLPPGGFDELATKGDLDALRVATKKDLEALRVATKTDLEALRVATKGDLEALKVAAKGDLEALEHRLTARMERLGRQLVIWTSSMVVAAVALAFAAGRLG